MPGIMIVMIFNSAVFLILVILGIRIRKHYYASRFLQDLIGHTRTGYIRFRYRDGVMLDINKGMIDILELPLSRDEVIGKDIREFFITGEGRQEIKEILMKHAGSQMKRQSYFRTLGGEKKWVLHDSHFIRDPHSGDLIVQAFAEDVTRQQEEFQKKTETEERYEKLFIHSGDIVVLYDLKESRILEVNPVTEVITGYKSGELIGQPFEMLIHPSYRQELAKSQEELLIKGGTRLRAVVVCKDGKYREAWLTLSAFLIEGKKVIMSVVKDISELVREREEQKKIREELENIREASFKREERIKELREELKRAQSQLDIFNTEKEHDSRQD